MDPSDSSEVKALAELIDMLRAKGVRRFKAADLELELDAPTAASDSKPEVDPDLCRCGHPSYMHVNGLCAQGCDVEACAPPAEPEKPK
jgi:hypothetical protein